MNSSADRAADTEDKRTNGEGKLDNDVSVEIAISEATQANLTLGPAEPTCFVRCDADKSISVTAFACHISNVCARFVKLCKLHWLT